MTTAVDALGFDPFEPGFRADPYPHYRALQERGSLVTTSGGLMLATTHETCTAVLRDNRFGHGGYNGPAPSFLLMDPPEHTRLRAQVSRSFTPRMIERLRPRIAAIAGELLSDGVNDLIEDFAYPLPITVISELLGVPVEDRETFRGWSDALARGLDPDFTLPPALLERRDAARAEFRAYFLELVARRRAEPGDDLLSALVTSSDMTEGELISTCILLLVAGHETTVNLIGNGTLALARADAFAEVTEDPETAVDELLRYDPPVQVTLRFALEETELAGRTLPRGQPVMQLLGAANRDPAAFADPDRLDLRRKSARHLAFGLGIHFCLGAPLARLEAQIALTALAERGIRVLDDAPPYKDHIVLRGLANLPVTLA